MALRAPQRDAEGPLDVRPAWAPPAPQLVVKLQLSEAELRWVVEALGELYDLGPNWPEHEARWDELHPLLHRVEDAYRELYRANRPQDDT